MQTSDIKAQSVRDNFDNFDKFEEKSIHLRDLLNKRKKQSACMTVCVGCVCFPCIFCVGLAEYIFSPKKKEDILL